MAPLFHVRNDVPPLLLITGNHNLELPRRYEENACLWRMMQVLQHPDTELYELEGFDHGAMPEAAHPLLVRFVRRIGARQSTEPADGQGAETEQLPTPESEGDQQCGGSMN